MTRSALLKGTFLTFVLIVTVAATPVLAGQNLMGELPEGHNTVIVADFSELRDSPLYSDGFEMLEDLPAAASAIDHIDQQLGVDVQRDISALVIASDSPPLSSQMVDDPMDALDDPSQHQSDGALILIRGDIDTEAILAELDDDDESDPPTTVRQSGLEIQRLTGNTLAISAGSNDYLDRSRARLDDERSGPGTAFERGIRQLGASQGIYMMTRPTVSDPDAVRDELGGVASFGAVTVDLGPQVRLGGLLTLSDEEEAAQMVKELDEVRSEAEGNPLVGLFGLQPVLDNLSVQKDEQHVVVRTSLGNDDASRLLSRLHSMARTHQDLQQPLPGFEPEEQDDDSDDGVDADFN